MFIYSTRLLGGPDGSEIVSLAYDINSMQLAVVHRSENIHLFYIDGAMVPRIKKSRKICHHWPQSVAFGMTTAGGVEVWSFGREDGDIGHAIISVKDDIIALDDTSQGICLYQLSVHHRLKTYPVPATSRVARGRNVAFVDGNSALACGSDHGAIYVFDRRSGENTDILRLGFEDWAQSLATAEIRGVQTIAAGRTSENAGVNDILIWSKKPSSVIPVTSEGTLDGERWKRVALMISALFLAQNMVWAAKMCFYGLKTRLACSEYLYWCSGK
ncbi:hypothetical protein VNI00_015508 [Paramarasmius palmivorus]|uniref:Uncharacterized protein n=1 Tax=Paramarasmius palmivorus TaxID=297713 RepID=A0AAW0BKM1_9AGAR